MLCVMMNLSVEVMTDRSLTMWNSIMSKPNAHDYNRVMNGVWEYVPRDVKYNVWRKHAATYCKAMWRKWTGKKLPFKIRYGSGNRNTWVARGVLTINPDSGWEQINHDFSHFLERRTTGEGHSDHHLEVERYGALMIRRRFLEGDPDPDVRIPVKRDKPNRTWRVIAAELNIEIEVDPFGTGSCWGIWPPNPIIDNEELDPWHYEGHYVHDVTEARERVLSYASMI